MGVIAGCDCDMHRPLLHVLLLQQLLLLLPRCPGGSKTSAPQPLPLPLALALSLALRDQELLNFSSLWHARLSPEPA